MGGHGQQRLLLRLCHSYTYWMTTSGVVDTPTMTYAHLLETFTARELPSHSKELRDRQPEDPIGRVIVPSHECPHAKPEALLQLFCLIRDNHTLVFEHQQKWIWQ